MNELCRVFSDSDGRVESKIIEMSVKMNYFVFWDLNDPSPVLCDKTPSQQAKKSTLAGNGS